jgi:hypothetical protein
MTNHTQSTQPKITELNTKCAHSQSLVEHNENTSTYTVIDKHNCKHHNNDNTSMNSQSQP